MRFNRYDHYKPISLKWLSQAPSGWSTARLSKLATVKARLGWKGLKADEYVSDGFALLATPNIKGRAVDFSNVNYITRERYEESPEIMLSEGDVLLAKDGSTLGICNVIRHLPRPATVNSSLAVIRPKAGLDSVYAYYFLSSSYIQSVIQEMKDGMGVPHLFQDDLNRFGILVPPLPEQRAIASFLDRETAKIDTLIAKQKKLVEHIEEKRNAVITCAVLRGLDHSVRMRDSGIDWIGQLPASWDLRSLNSLTTKITNGYVGPTRDILVEEGIAYLQSLHIKNNQIRFDNRYFVTEEWSNLHVKSILRVNDVLIVQTGDVGQVAVVTHEFEGANCHALIVVSCIESLLEGRYLSWLLNSDYGQNALRAIQTGALHPHLNCGNVKFIPIPVPSLEEQRHIVSHIEVELRKYDRMAEAARRMVEQLAEHRTAVITAAVTGQIDVACRPALEAAE